MQEEIKSTHQSLTVLLAIATFFAVINNTVFNVAIPLMQVDYGLTAGEVSLVSVVYLAIFSVGTMVYGKLADFIVLQKLYISGLGIFAAGSIIGYFAPNYAMLLFGRMVQASGASAIPALSMLAFNQFFDVEGRVQGITLIAMMASLGGGAGPVIGGFVSQFLGYRFLFMLSAMVVFLIPFLLRSMPKGQKGTGSFDQGGCVLFSVAIFLLLVGVSVDTFYAVIGIGLLGVFLFYVQHHAKPFISLQIFDNSLFLLLLIIGLLSFLVSIGNLFLLPMVLKKVNLLSPVLVGYALLPGAICAAFSGKLAKKLYQNWGAFQILYVILGGMFVGFFLLSTFVGSSPLVLSGLAILIYVGFGSVQVVLGSFMFEVLSARDINVGMGLYNLCSFVGGALGPALTAKYLDLSVSPFLNYWNHSSSFCDSYMLLAAITGVALMLVGVASQVEKSAVSLTTHREAEG
jgi:MFS transporter, DHA2 family, metal-tetracycline-proton antiporter